MFKGGCSSSQAKHPTVQEAGRLGGLKLFHNRGRAYFAEIGRRGQRTMRQKHPDMASRWGKLGGRPKKLTLGQIMGEKSK
jgi:general stress protein YciG